MRIEPKTIINKYLDNDLNASKTARELGVHRSTVIRWYKRGLKLCGLRPLRSINIQRKSTKPHNVNLGLAVAEKRKIRKIRENYGYCARKLKSLLKLDASRNTIHRFLKSEGLVNRYGNHIRPRYQKTKHMYLRNTKTVGYLQMDVKYITPELSGLPWTCYEYGVIDIYSRYKDAVILNHLDMDGSTSVLREIVKRLPFEAKFVQTDNGLEFQSRFVKNVTALGLKHHFTHKSSPNENAVIERSFRTDEEEFFFRLMKKPKHYDDLRNQFKEFLRVYNNMRPHLGLNLKTPAEVVAYVLGH